MLPSLRFALVASFVFTCFLGLAYPSTIAQTPPIQAGQVLISEARLRGPAGAEDEFIEIYNNTDQAITVQALDASTGWTVAVSNGQITGPTCTIPNGTIIPARGHLLCANTNGYSLASYPSGNQAPIIAAISLPQAIVAPSPSPFAPTIPDRTWDFDVPDGSGMALFATTNGTNFTAATRLDAFGFTSSPALYREGGGFATVVTANTEHTYYRDLKAVTPKDTNNNSADFRLVGTAPNIQVTQLGAPGPENLNSPTLNTAIAGTLLDPALPASQVPNRERRLTVEPNADLGTILIRRTLTNNTGQPVSRLRFRVIDITTLGTPANECGGCADVRALTSFDGASTSGGQPVTVRGLRLEEPPSQPAGGGMNASVSADFITLSSPMLPGEILHIEFKLGVMRTGTFRYYVAIEAQTGAAPPILTFTASRKNVWVEKNSKHRLQRSVVGSQDESESFGTMTTFMRAQPTVLTSLDPAQPAPGTTASGQPFILRSLAPAKRVDAKRRKRVKRVSLKVARS
jgi:hypothetical protein